MLNAWRLNGEVKTGHLSNSWMTEVYIMFLGHFKDFGISRSADFTAIVCGLVHNH